ncbi:MAG: threonine ammonia-lyase [Chloroflexota bacterium]|nr:MAG: threonine ammonia-lyase [Chloroflexota bacterium]
MADQTAHARLVQLADIRAAQSLLAPVVHRTPVLHSRLFSQMTGADVHLKLESFQRTGSFKIRGAYNKMVTLSEAERAAGVITASAGNHAQGVALAAQLLGVPATIVMPLSASLAKIAATESYGATIELSGSTYDEAYAQAVRLARQHGLIYVPAFDDPAIIAGQGTVGLELMEQLPDVDLVIVPAGGGGLVAGIAVAVKSIRPSARVVAVQSSLFDTFAASLKHRPPSPVTARSTVADGVAVQVPGALTLELGRRLIDDAVTVDDEAICQSIVLLLERTKVVVEGAGAVGLAALLSGGIRAHGQKVAVVLSGGNIDINLMARIIQHGLTTAGRYLMIRSRLLDRPGQLLGLIRLLADEGVNVLNIEHHRAGALLPVDEVEVLLTLETRDPAHCEHILTTLRQAGYEVERAR